MPVSRKVTPSSSARSMSGKETIDHNQFKPVVLRQSPPVIHLCGKVHNLHLRMDTARYPKNYSGASWPLGLNREAKFSFTLKPDERTWLKQWALQN